MSYLHCPTCRRAYNVATQAACPSCGVSPGAPADPTDDVVAAAEQLARAIARATPSQVAIAEAELSLRAAQLALPAPGARQTAVPSAAPSVLRAVRAALVPPPPAPPVDAAISERSKQALLTSVVLALLTRIPKRRPSVRAWASAHVLPRARALLARN